MVLGLTFFRARFGGQGYVAGQGDGIVTIAALPAAREVELREYTTRTTIGTTFSASNGTYRFDSIDPTIALEAIGRDWKGEYDGFLIGPFYAKPY